VYITVVMLLLGLWWCGGGTGWYGGWEEKDLSKLGNGVVFGLRKNVWGLKYWLGQIILVKSGYRQL
jgi:hypothetical protein